MKGFTLLIVILLFPGCASSTRSATSWEDEVRAAEERHLAAFRSGDAAAIDALFSDDFLVNSPRYDVLDKRQLMELVRRGLVNTASFTQNIDNIRRYGDIAIVMGGDTVVFAQPAPNAGQTIRRRFTDIWRIENGRWNFVARHANPICDR